MTSLPHAAAILGSFLVLALAGAILGDTIRSSWPAIVAALRGEPRP